MEERIDELLKRYSEETEMFSFTDLSHPSFVELRGMGESIIPRLRHWMEKGKEADWKNRFPVSPWALVALISMTTYIPYIPREHAGRLREVVQWFLDHTEDFK